MPGQLAPTVQEGEVNGVYFKVQGAGTPLVLLPLGAAPSQWDPIVPALSEQFCVISMSGPALGMVASLEGRGRTPGYLSAAGAWSPRRNCSPGRACSRWGAGPACCALLARETSGANPVTGVDVNTFFLREGAEIARREGVEGCRELSRRER